MTYPNLGKERESHIRPRIPGPNGRTIRLPSPSEISNSKRPFRYHQKVKAARMYMRNILHQSDSGLTSTEILMHVVGATAHIRAYELRGGRQRHQSQHRRQG